MSAPPDVAPFALIVEDDDDLALLLEFILGREGYRTERCADGRIASEAIGLAPVPELVLLDLLLPYVNGLELIKQIRENASWGGVPILMLTAQNGEQDVARALDAGADDYLVKPFQPEELKARLRRLRRGRR
ncbi:response regulator transcription factor [Pseudomarimonas salicorniae]|uniref:Response regulator n=1 Tax=Pseudomarimonas salicorniae TaxID=2933270 RepID=A0ABT0GE64_9GAMM|nr:response regulator [Lysobacter sp. CAU 1642]MCK7592302.1 response regulator [Lysobacter sp. CAU 1642]